MAEPFIDLADTRQRIHRTICMYDGKPMYVSVMDVDLVGLYPLRRERGEPNHVRVTDKKFSYKSVPLGYINYQNNALYVMRIPARQTRAGISPENLTTIPQVPTEDFFLTKAFEDCILGKHPGLRTAVKSLLDVKAASVAVHRHVALSWYTKDFLRVQYRGTDVGKFDVQNNMFIFNNTPWRSFLERIVADLHLQEGKIFDDAA